MDRTLEYFKLLNKNLRKYYWDELGLKDYQERINIAIERTGSKSIFNRISNYCFIDGQKILDVGSGWGGICVELAHAGGIVTGIEPNKEELQISKLLNEIEGTKINFIHGYGENLLFTDNSFDILICFSVIEHVADVSKVISEMLRVLRPGGFIYLNTMNYLFPYEGHYKIFFPSLFPKFLAKIYLKLIGRNPNFIKSINYITTFKIFSEFRKYDVKIDNLGIKKLEKSRLLRGSGFFKRMLRRFLTMTKFYPYIELFIVKGNE
jgi:2-polyprenyl-3-methyl-5-hydroxy-6-metoxy-1,4-benzoquinol methylase